MNKGTNREVRPFIHSIGAVYIIYVRKPGGRRRGDRFAGGAGRSFDEYLVTASIHCDDINAGLLQLRDDRFAGGAGGDLH